MKKFFLNKFILAGLFLFILAIPLSVKAFNIQTEDKVTIEKEEVINENLYFFTENTTIKGTIKGDAIGITNNLKISSDAVIEGDLIVLSREALINGIVEGSVRGVIEDARINNKIGKNIMILGDYLSINELGLVGWDGLFITKTSNIKGEVGRNIRGLTQKMNISGKINGDVDVKIQTTGSEQIPITITDQAAIEGGLSYTALNQAQISDSADIKGDISHRTPRSQKSNGFSALGYLFSATSYLIIGFLTLILLKKPLFKTTSLMKSNYISALGWGVALFFLLPGFSLAFLITFIGIPLSFILLAVFVIMVILSRILVAFMAGKLIIKISKIKNKSPYLAMTIGVVASWLLFSLPTTGWMLSLLAIWFGLGGMFMFIKQNLKK